MNTGLLDSNYGPSQTLIGNLGYTTISFPEYSQRAFYDNGSAGATTSIASVISYQDQDPGSYEFRAQDKLADGGTASSDFKDGGKYGNYMVRVAAVPMPATVWVNNRHSPDHECAAEPDG